MIESKEEKLKDATWAELCRQFGWVCKLCDVVPQIGKRFEEISATTAAYK